MRGKQKELKNGTPWRCVPFLILIIPLTLRRVSKNVFLLIIEICLQCVVDAFHHILKIGIVRIHRTGLLRNFLAASK